LDPPLPTDRRLLNGVEAQKRLLAGFRQPDSARMGVDS
jgi:hypothetical protein